MDGAKGRPKRLPSLRTASSLVIGGTLLIFVGIIVFVFVSGILTILDRHERENIRQQGNLATGAVDSAYVTLKNITRDWSSWDETYAFALGENDAYLTDVMGEYPMLLHNLNVAAVKKLDGSDAYLALYDVAGEQFMPVPDGFARALDKMARDVLDSYSPGTLKEDLGREGFIISGGVCYYICAMPILDSEETLEPAGTFFFGHVFDDAEVERIIGRHEISYSVLQSTSPEAAALSFENGEAFSFTSDRFTYYRALPDYFGEQTVVIRVDAERSMHKDGLRAVMTTCVFAGAAVLALLALSLVLINSYFVSPVSRLSADMEAVTASTQSVDVREYGGTREFFALGAAINTMLWRLEQGRVSLEKSTFSLTALQNILSGMDAYIYVSDTETDEILFINDRMREHFGLSGSAVGKTCWKVLQSGFTERCPFCPNHKLKHAPDEAVVWEEHNTATNRHYRNIDRIIEWSDGKLVHLQHSVDITEVKLAEQSLKKRLAQQELMSEISQSFTAGEDAIALIRDALKMAGEFMHVNQVFISRYDEQRAMLDCIHEWYDGHGVSFIENGGSWPFGPDMPLFNDLQRDGYSAVGDLSRMTHPNFEAVRGFDFNAFLDLPIEVDGELWGVLGFIFYDGVHEWDESDIHLGKLIAGIMSGVISRNLSEETLFDTKQMLSAVLDNAPMAIFWKDLDLRFQGFNSRFAEFVGLDAEQIIGQTDVELLGEEYALRNRLRDLQALEYTDSVTYDEMLKNHQGETRWLHINKSAIRDSRGRPTYVVGVFEDVTENKKTEELLHKMSAIVNSARQYIAYVKPDGKFDFFSPATERITGYSFGELMENGIDLLYDEPTRREISEKIFPEIFAHGQYEFELPLRCKSGEVRIMAFSAFTIESDEHGIGMIASDVTDRRKLEQALIEAKEMAEQGSRAKGEFLSRMSHEMRTPMTAIIGMTGIARSSNDPEKKEYCLERIDNASKHLLGVINDILDMSKIESGKFELADAEFDFVRMLVNVTGVVNFRAEEKSQNLVVNVSDCMPATLIGDEQRFAQVITNLLANAIKFTPEYGTITLNVSGAPGDDGMTDLMVEVIDTGIGISAEQQSRLFTSFEQADGGISRRFGGTGLGLVISKRIVELMNGRIWIESELGYGAKFSFTARLKTGLMEPRRADAPELDAEQLRILAVDDSPEIREYFMHVMPGLGFDCETADCAAAALERIGEPDGDSFNVFFIDWMMPDMNGIELTRQIKAMRKNRAVIIMISVADWMSIEQEALLAGVDRFVSKPLFPSTIVDAINETVGAPRAAGADEHAETGRTVDFKGRTILLADDVDINREIICALLEDTNLTIDTAQNGLEAVELFSQTPSRYSAVLMDIHMPEMDGYEATRTIRSMSIPEAKRVPIIAMTANVFREDVERCLEAGMNSHIGKPIDPDELLDKLDRFIRPKGRAGV